MEKYGILIILCLTLGLAPFFPEPHIWGKLRWILGGAKEMTAVDWGDACMHGLPWMVLLFVVVRDLVVKGIRPTAK